MLGSCLYGVLANMALIEEGDFDGFTSLGLDSFRKFSDMRLFLFIRGGDKQGE